jgi:ubiquinone/menaquinone biosynthesis C-methylase UbiE
MSTPSKSPWNAPETVAGFVESPPNGVLLRFAEEERRKSQCARALDIGCGAGRNTIPLARLEWHVVGLDLSWPMLCAAARRAREERVTARMQLAVAPMDSIPARDGSFDLIVAHGIWNLARSSAEFRRGVREAARVARSGAALFVFTFSRNTLPPQAQPSPANPSSLRSSPDNPNAS